MNLKTTGKFNHPIFGELCVYSDENHNCWFIANKVCKSLGYTNTSKAISDNCEGYNRQLHPILTSGGKQDVLFISEPDLYALIFGSKLEKAKQFRKWVFEDVLTSIRKTGMYVRQDIIDRMKNDLPWGIELLKDLKSGLNNATTQRKIAQVKETATGFTGVNHLFGWK